MHDFLELHDPIPYISLQTGEIHDVDISLEVEQGLCNTVDKLLMIIHEFYNIYMECKHIPEPHGCTVSSAAQLLRGLHQVMESRDREEVAESVSQHSAILTVLGSAISKHRECKLQIDTFQLNFSYACTMQVKIFSHMYSLASYSQWYLCQKCH